MLTKQFKLLSRSSEILKIKIGLSPFEFKSIDKLIVNTLKTRIVALEKEVKELKDDAKLVSAQLNELIEWKKEIERELQKEKMKNMQL